MPRINIEERLWTDPRLDDLESKMGSKELALGTLLYAWRLAQRYWVPDKRLIPKTVFDKYSTQLLIECEFAALTDDQDFVYIKGTEKNFEWLFLRRESGRKGGLKKSENGNHSGKFLANASKSKQTVASSSSSFSNTNTNTLSKQENQQPEQQPKARQLASKEDLEQIYQLYYPRREGKTIGLKRLLAERLRKDELPYFERAVKKYANHCMSEKKESQFIKLFSTFASSWKDWLDPDVGTCSVQAVPGFDRINTKSLKDELWANQK